MSRALFGFRLRSSCPACASTQSRLRYRCRFDQDPIAAYLAGRYGVDPRRLAHGEYRLQECLACSTIYQAEVGDNELLTELYSRWVKRTEAPENDPGYAYDMANPEKSRDGHEIIAASSYLGVPLNQMQVLDYGMGWASWSRVAVQLGCRAFGLDLAEDRIAFARKHGITPLADPEIESGRYHFINTEQSMEHFTDPGPVSKRFADALLPGGVLKISVPSNFGVESFLKRLNAGQASVTHSEIMPVHPLEHVNCFTLDGLRQLGRRWGLEPARPGIFDRYAFLGHRGSLDLRRPKRLAKELVRPWYQFRNPRNLYVWLRKAT